MLNLNRLGDSVITEIVTFHLPTEMTRIELLAKYRETSKIWRQNADLLHKQYFHDAERNIGGGVYLWKNMDAAKKWHGDAYQTLIRNTYGSKPMFQYFDCCRVVDNLADTVYAEPPAA
jgi:hypothetical protein